MEKPVEMIYHCSNDESQIVRSLEEVNLLKMLRSVIIGKMQFSTLSQCLNNSYGLVHDLLRLSYAFLQRNRVK
jgi:hypothetical protein